MNAGSLDRRIKIEQPKQEQDSRTGQLKTPTWLPFAEVWARRSPAMGGERFLADQRIAEADTIFRVRYLRGVLPTMRVVDADGRAYDIKGTQEVGRREGLDILAKARTE